MDVGEMPKKSTRGGTVTTAAYRVAMARRIIAEQEDVGAWLKAAGGPTLDAERLLQTYLSSLWQLESHAGPAAIERMSENQIQREANEIPDNGPRVAYDRLAWDVYS